MVNMARLSYAFLVLGSTMVFLQGCGCDDSGDKEMNVMSFGVLHPRFTHFPEMKDYHGNTPSAQEVKLGLGASETKEQKEARWLHSTKIVVDAVNEGQIVLLQGVSHDYAKNLSDQGVNVYLSYNTTAFQKKQIGQIPREKQGGPAVCYPKTSTVVEEKGLTSLIRKSKFAFIRVPYGWAAVRISSTWYVSVHLWKDDKEATQTDEVNMALLKNMRDTIDLDSATNNFTIVIGGDFHGNNATTWMQNISSQLDMSKISIVGNSPTKFDMKQKKTESRDEIWISGKPRGQVTVKCDTPMQPWATDNKVGSDHCPIEWVGTTSGSPAGAPGFLSLTVIVATFILVL